MTENRMVIETNKYNEMLRESEDYYDTIDSEIEFREDLKKDYITTEHQKKSMGGVQRKIMLIERCL